MINNFIINVKNFLKRDYFLCKILYCFFISILNFYLAEHSATHHQIRSSLEIFVLPFFFFSLGAIPSAILNSILISLILFDIVVTYNVVLLLIRLFRLLLVQINTKLFRCSKPIMLQLYCFQYL